MRAATTENPATRSLRLALRARIKSVVLCTQHKRSIFENIPAHAIKHQSTTNYLIRASAAIGWRLHDLI